MPEERPRPCTGPGGVVGRGRAWSCCPASRDGVARTPRSPQSAGFSPRPVISPWSRSRRGSPSASSPRRLWSRPARRCEWAASASDTREGRVTLVGVSGGASLALLVAADEPVRRVTALAPCCDIREALRMVTTGVYGHAPFRVRRLLPARDRPLHGRLATAGRRPFRTPRASPRARGLRPRAARRRSARGPARISGTTARALVELLANEDPARFDDLYAALPSMLRANAELLSPLSVAARIQAPVEVVAPRRDKYLPLADSLAFTDACPPARLTVLGSISHVVPTLSPRDLRGLAQLDAVLVRLLAGARAPSYSRS